MPTVAPSGASSLVALLHLASPALPIGAFAYSDGLEAAVEARVVVDEASARAFLADALEATLATNEIPIVLRLFRAFATGAEHEARAWNEYALASRETAELRASTAQMGFSLRRWLRDVALVEQAHPVFGWEEVALPASFALAAIALRLDAEDAALAFAWSWLENVALAAVKTVPLGQAVGQRILLGLGASLPDVVRRAALLDDEELCNFAPALAIASARHETQYTRLYRS